MRALVLAVALAFVVSPAAAAVRTVTVPHLVGKQKPAAVAQLHRLGLPPKIGYAKSLELVGTVVAQSVKAGVRVRLGTRITLTISSGVGP
jgi:beta-lactam-binding protein with PASTA domain